MHPTVLVLGATGRFGSAAALAFARAGWRVVAQRRPGRPAAPSHAGVTWVDAQPSDTRTLLAACGRADVVVHALNPAYTARAWRTEAMPLLEQAIAAARACGALLMFPGNVYNFGSRMPAVLREDTPQRADTVKGRVRVQLERRLAEAARQEGVRTVVIRAGDYFGSGRGNLLDRVVAKDLPRGRMGLPGAIDVATPFAYLPDLADTFVRVAMARDRLQAAEVLHFRGHVLRGSDWRDVLTPIAVAQGFVPQGSALKASALPWGLIRAGGLLIPEWAAMAEMRYLWTTPHALDNARLVALIGEEPHTPLAHAVSRALGELGIIGGPQAHVRIAA